LIYDETGDRLCPTHANKKGRRYRYYISKRLMHKTGSSTGGWRLSAKELETAVLLLVREFLRDGLRIVEALLLNDESPGRLRTIIHEYAAAADEMTNGPTERQAFLLSALVHRIDLGANSLGIEFKRSGLLGLPSDSPAHGATASDETFSIVIPIQLKRRGVEAKLVMEAERAPPASPDEKLIAVLADAYRWLDDLTQGRAASLRDLARLTRRDVGEISRTLPLAFLAPNIIYAIVDGRQPVGVTPRRLTRIGTLPFCWDEQCRQLDFPRL
jgi:site-specific DNA recombinase